MRVRPRPRTVQWPLRDVTRVARPRVVGSITLGHGANEFFSIAFPPIIPILVSDLGISYAQAGFLLTVFFVMYSVFQLPAGLVGDRIRKKRMLVVGLAVMSGGILLASLAPDYTVLLVAQAIAGIGGSTFHPTGMALISDVETTDTEGKAMGVFGFGGVIGTIASPVVIGGVAVLVNWRIALGIAAVLGIVVTVLFIPLFRDPGMHQTKDSVQRPDGGRSPTIRERISAFKAVVDLHLTWGIVVLFFATFFLSLETRALHGFTTAYIAAETGGSTSIGNLVFFALLVGAGLASLWAGSLADRFERGTIGGLAAIATAVLVGATIFVARILGDLSVGLSLGILGVWFFLIGIAVYACFPVKNALISEQSQREFSGSFFGVMQTASAIGSALGPAVFGVLATKWGVIAAYPAIATASIIVAGLFFLLAVLR